MTFDEDIEKIAKPILDQLEEIFKKANPETLAQLPQIHFLHEPLEEPIMYDDVEITEEFISKLEEYIQEELEMMHQPTILH